MEGQMSYVVIVIGVVVVLFGAGAIWRLIAGGQKTKTVDSALMDKECTGCGWSGRVSQFHKKCPNCGNQIY